MELTWKHFLSIGIILVIVAFFSISHAFIWLLPHERITISLPFAQQDDDLIFINPMGETVMHPDSPRGHPGLDLAWNHPVNLTASASGKITKIERHPDDEYHTNVWDVETVNGIYAIRYSEITPAAGLKVGMRVNHGDVIGIPGGYASHNGTHYSVHWEFDYDSVVYDRLCPMTYFDEGSLERINAIWDKVGTTYDGRFTEVCSGAYEGRDV